MTSIDHLGFMKKSITFIFILLTLTFATTPVHAKRLPSAKKVQSITQKFFKSYGKKYPSTPYGIENVDQVQINKIYEVSYKIVFADVILNFKDGRIGRAIMKMQNKFPKGWHVISWEIVGIQ